MHLLKTLTQALESNLSLFQRAPSKLFFLIENKLAATAVALLLAIMLQAGLFYIKDDEFDLGNTIEFISILTSFFIAGLFYFKNSVVQGIASKVMDSPYTAIIGLSSATKQLLDNEVTAQQLNYLVISPELEASQYDQYIRQGVGVLNGDIFDPEFVKNINFHNMEKAVISLGNDRLNIEAATALIKHYQVAEDKNSPVRIVVEINDRDLNELFFQNLINWNLQNKKIEIQTFSFYESCVEQIFENHDVDSLDRRIINSNDPWDIVVVGEGLLLKELVYQIGKLAHLPNQNPLTLHIVHRNAEKIKQSLIKSFSGIEKVMSLETHVLGSESPNFYQDEIWQQANLTRVFLCDDDEEKNVSIATSLFNKTYLKRAVHKQMTTEVFFAVFNSYSLNEDMASNVNNLKSFHAFGEMQHICTPDIVINDEQNLIGRLVHLAYGDEYNPLISQRLDEECLLKINQKWFDTAKPSDKLSSKAQAKHIRIKLKALGFTMTKSELSPSELLTHNRTLLDASLEQDRNAVGLNDDALKTYSLELAKVWSGQTYEIQYFPKDYSNLFEKLIRCEHDRWNAFHYMNGWHYAPKTDKPSKEHICLKPLREFIEPELQITVIYDIYSILYIPNYLANAGYSITQNFK